MTEYKPIPVEEAHRIAKSYEKSQVIILTWDSVHKLMHATTFGESMEDKKQAAEGSKRIMAFLGADLDRKSIFEDELGLL
jgi:hypothetical protein